jgi:hypothetical protein
VEQQRLRCCWGQIHGRGGRGWVGKVLVGQIRWVSSERCCAAHGSAFSAIHGIGGVPSVERRLSPSCGGPHGGGKLHAQGRWGSSSLGVLNGAVSSMVVLGAVSTTTMLAARLVPWWWISAWFQACRSSMELAVWFGRCCREVDIAVDAGAAQVCFLGLWMVSLWWSQWSSSLAEQPWRFLERDNGVSGGRARRWRCYLFLLSGVRPVVVVLCFMYASFVNLRLCLVRRCHLSGLRYSQWWILCFNWCHVLVRLYRGRPQTLSFLNMKRASYDLKKKSSPSHNPFLKFLFMLCTCSMHHHDKFYEKELLAILQSGVNQYCQISINLFSSTLRWYYPYNTELTVSFSCFSQFVRLSIFLVQ